MQITAAVLRDADGPHRLEPLDLAVPGPHEVLVRVVAAGMCHTDVLPRMSGAVSIVTGHEGAGVVESVGRDVTSVAVGDHVVLSFDSCGACVSCARGVPSCCDTFMARNLTGRRVDGSTGAVDGDGAEVSSRWFGQSSFATHCIATERNAVRVPGDAPLATMAPLGCGVLTGAGSVLVALDVQPGSSIVVFGAGAVGLSAVMAAVVAGASTIVAVDRHRSRLDLAVGLGATDTVLVPDDDLVHVVRSLVGGASDHSIDTTGDPGVILAALGVLRMSGHCALVGVQQGILSLDPMALVGKTVTGVLEGQADPHELIPRLVELWRDGRFPVERLIETFPFEAIDEAEAASLSGRVVKPVLLIAPDPATGRPTTRGDL